MTEFILRSDAGQIPLRSTPGPLTLGYTLMSGTRGLGLPGVSTSWAESPAGGSRFVSSRYTSREPLLRVGVRGTDRTDLQARVQALADMLEPDLSPRLVSTGHGLTTGELELPFRVTDWDPDGYKETDTETTLELSVRTPHPYWEAPLASLPAVSYAAGGTVTVGGGARTPLALLCAAFPARGGRLRMSDSTGVVGEFFAKGGTPFAVMPTPTGWQVLGLSGSTVLPDVNRSSVLMLPGDAPDVLAPRFPVVKPGQVSIVFAALNVADTVTGSVTARVRRRFGLVL